MWSRKISINIKLKKKGDTSSDFQRILLALLAEYEDSGNDDDDDSEPDEPEIPLEDHVVEEREEPTIEETPTLVACPNFNPNADSEKLRKAMKGLGTDEKAIIDVLGFRDNEQRQEVLSTYKTMLGRDLLKDLHGEISGSFRDTIESMMMTPIDYDAASFRKAVKGFGTNG